MRDNGPTIGERSFVNHALAPGRRPRRAVDWLRLFPAWLRSIPNLTLRVLAQGRDRLSLPLLRPVAIDARGLARHAAQQDMRATAPEWLRIDSEMVEAVARMPHPLEIRRRVPVIDREPVIAERLPIFCPAPIAEIAQDRLASSRSILINGATIISPKPIHQRDICLRAGVFSFHLHRQF